MKNPQGSILITGATGFIGRRLTERLLAFCTVKIKELEEGRLNDPRLRGNFIERLFSYRRWKDFLTSGSTLGRLVEFHTAHKLLNLIGYYD